MTSKSARTFYADVNLASDPMSIPDFCVQSIHDTWNNIGPLATILNGSTKRQEKEPELNGGMQYRLMMSILTSLMK